MNRRELLRLLIDQKYGGNAAAFSRAIKKASSQVNQWLSGHRNLGDAGARHIEIKLNLDQGAFDDPHRTSWLDQDRSDHANTEPGPDIKGHVPLISTVQAGGWAEAIDNFHPGDAEDWLPCPVSHGPRTYALRVQGDSMTASHGRSYPDGCLIYVDPDQGGGVVSGDRVVAKITGDPEVTFKVYVVDGGRRFLRPLNPQFPIIDSEFRVLGKVLAKLEVE